MAGKPSIRSFSHVVEWCQLLVRRRRAFSAISSCKQFVVSTLRPFCSLPCKLLAPSAEQDTRRLRLARIPLRRGQRIAARVQGAGRWRQDRRAQTLLDVIIMIHDHDVMAAVGGSRRLDLLRGRHVSTFYRLFRTSCKQVYGTHVIALRHIFGLRRPRITACKGRARQPFIILCVASASKHTPNTAPNLPNSAPPNPHLLWHAATCARSARPHGAMWRTHYTGGALLIAPTYPRPRPRAGALPPVWKRMRMVNVGRVI